MSYDSTDLSLSFAAGVVLAMVSQYIVADWLALLSGL